MALAQERSAAWRVQVRPRYVIDLYYGYRYLLDVYSELSDLYFVIWLHYHSMLALYNRPVLAMVNIMALELWQLL